MRTAATKVVRPVVPITEGQTQNLCAVSAGTQVLFNVNSVEDLAEAENLATQL